jgi:hypothetical protein
MVESEVNSKRRVASLLGENPTPHPLFGREGIAVPAYQKRKRTP